MQKTIHTPTYTVVSAFSSVQPMVYNLSQQFYAQNSLAQVGIAL